MKEEKEIIGIKIGSVLLSKNGALNTQLIYKLGDQINALLERNYRVFLVSSGDVASCPAIVNSPKNLQAALGQGFLISKYIQIFSVFGIQAAQILVTDHDINEAGKGLVSLLSNISMYNRNYALNKIVPIFNANNAVDWNETDQLKECSDNDNLFCRLCLLFKANMAVVGFDGPCVINDDPENKTDKEKVRVINEENYDRLFDYVRRQIRGCEGYLYRGGIITKMIAGRTLAENGVKTILADGNEELFVVKAIRDLVLPTYEMGTHFIFDQKQPSIFE